MYIKRDRSDGRALEMLLEGRGFKSRSELNFLKALVWSLHVRFRVVMCKMGYIKLRFIYIYIYSAHTNFHNIILYVVCNDYC